MTELAFTVYGEAKGAGSKVSFPQRDKAGNIVLNAQGKPIIRTKDSSGADGKSWRYAVAIAARQVFQGALLRGPLELQITFYRPRNKGDFGTGRNAGVLKPSAPPFPTTRPDVLKLARAVEDALTGVVWADDSQIVDEHIFKRYDEPARCEVVIRTRDPEPSAEALTFQECLEPQPTLAQS